LLSIKFPQLYTLSKVDKSMVKLIPYLGTPMKDPNS